MLRSLGILGRWGLDRTRLLQGVPMPVESPFSHETWAFKVPRLAGLPGGWTAEEYDPLAPDGQRAGRRAASSRGRLSGG